MTVRGTERTSFPGPYGKRIGERYVKEVIRRFERIIESEEG